MLVLARQRDQTVIIGDDIEITVVDIRGDKVRLGINAPKNISVHRKEIYDAIKRENRAAAEAGSGLDGAIGNVLPSLDRADAVAGRIDGGIRVIPAHAPGYGSGPVDAHAPGTTHPPAPPHAPLEGDAPKSADGPLIPRGAAVPDPFLLAAIEEARLGLKEGGLPIGSVLVRNGKIVARGHNRRVQRNDPMAHAEIDCLTQAGRQKTYKDTVLYSTLMPCYLCSGAVVQFGIPRVVAGESVTFKGGPEFLRGHGVEVVDAADPTCIALMTDFIRDHPALWNEDIGK